MSEAFVLISCELGDEEKIVDRLQKIEQVSEVMQTYGVYEIVAKVESDSDKDLREVISEKIKGIEPVNAVLSLISNWTLANLREDQVSHSYHRSYSREALLE